MAGQIIPLTTDGLPWYAHAVEKFFGIDVDYAMQTRICISEPTALLAAEVYRSDREGSKVQS